MNQILSVEPPKNKKRSNKASINSILIVFSTFLIIFGLGLVSTGAYSYYINLSNMKENDVIVQAGTKPYITIERENANLINIVVTHDKAITDVTYTINEEEPVQILGDGKLEVKKEVELPVGSSNMVITAEDINGISSSYETSFEVEQKPVITLEQADTQIKATVESKINIDYVRYYWDEDEQNAQQLTINNDKTEVLVDVLAGTHTLNVVAVDMQGNQTIKSQKVIGDNKPEVKITTDNVDFIIHATDDEKLQKVEITLNSNETIVEEIDSNEYNKNIPLEEGLNKIIVVVYNINGISETLRVKYTKE